MRIRKGHAVKWFLCDDKALKTRDRKYPRPDNMTQNRFCLVGINIFHISKECFSTMWKSFLRRDHIQCNLHHNYIKNLFVLPNDWSPIFTEHLVHNTITSFHQVAALYIFRFSACSWVFMPNRKWSPLDKWRWSERVCVFISIWIFEWHRTRESNYRMMKRGNQRKYSCWDITRFQCLEQCETLKLSKCLFKQIQMHVCIILSCHIVDVLIKGISIWTPLYLQPNIFFFP